LRTTKIRGKISLVSLLRPTSLSRHAFCSVATESTDVWGLFQHVACDMDRLLHRTESSDSAATLIPAHDRSIHFLPIQCVERRPTASVEQRTLFHPLDHEYHRIHTLPPPERQERPMPTAARSTAIRSGDSITSSALPAPPWTTRNRPRHTAVVD
jgi:hypothetical protein